MRPVKADTKWPSVVTSPSASWPTSASATSRRTTRSTELPNRAYFSERLNALISGSQGKDARFAVLFVDLDHFKLINDTLGHEAGDALLKQAATRLRDSVRPDDVVARLGGDEFVVLCRTPATLRTLTPWRREWCSR